MEFQVAGKNRGMKLGTFTFRLINQMAGTKTTDEVFERMKHADNDFALTLFYCCAKHYAMSNKLPIDFDECEVADWVDELGMARMKEITDELFRVYFNGLLKNAIAPETGQVLQSSNGTI